MPRILHIFVIILLIGSVAYSYRIKYHSIALANEMARLKKDIDKTKNEIAEAKAEWQVLNNPDRLQKLADAHTQTMNMRVTQIIRWSDLPNRPPPSDPIADKLMSLGGTDKITRAAVQIGVTMPSKPRAAQAALPLTETPKE